MVHFEAKNLGSCSVLINGIIKYADKNINTKYPTNPPSVFLLPLNNSVARAKHSELLRYRL